MTTLLFVEDKQMHIDLIRRAFEDDNLSFDLEFAECLRDAEQFLANEIFDLVIVDWMLPDGKGIDLLYQAKKSEQGRYPLLIMTSQGNETVAVEAMKAGALDYIIKSPASFIEMPRTVQRVLREWGHIRARQEAELEAYRTLTELRTYLEAAAQGVLVINEQCEIAFSNQEAERIFGYSRDEIVGQLIDKFIPNTFCQVDLAHSKNPFLDTSTMPIKAIELEGYRKDGSVFPLEMNLNLALTETHQTVIAIFTDITERKRLQAEALETRRIQAELATERELRQYKERFLSMFSHEFRTPLAVIQNSIYLLNKYHAKMEENDLQGYFTQIVQQIDHLDNMVEDILLISKNDQQEIKFNPESLELKEFCLQVIDVAQKFAPNYHIVSKMNIKHNTVYFDKNLVEHILMNLIGNAIKYSPDSNQIRFYVEVNDNLIIFKVSDSGIGIPQTDQRKIFDLFHRATNVGKIKGTGLGLALVAEFVAMHAGAIQLESEPQVGTTFIVEIPLRKGSVFDLTRLPETDNRVITKSKKIKQKIVGLVPNQDEVRILVVDEGATNHNMLAYMLKSSGFVVQEISDRLEALKMLQQWQPRIILMNLRIPYQHDQAFIHQIRAVHTDQDVIIIGISASKLTIDDPQERLQDIDAVLGQPFHEDDLLQTIEKLVEVRFLYEDNKSKTSRVFKPSVEDLVNLPETLIESLQKATLLGQVHQLKEISSQIQTYNEAFSSWLDNLIRNYDYRDLHDLLSRYKNSEKNEKI